MVLRRLLLGSLTVIGMALCMTPNEAHAQYKNRAFGIYVGPGFFVFPEENRNWFFEQLVLTQQPTLPSGRISPGGNPFGRYNATLELEFLQKISMEAWFIKIGVTTMITPSFAAQTSSNSVDGKFQPGVTLWFEPSVAPRVYLATDNIRPFIEFGFRLAIPVFTTTTSEIMPDVFRAIPSFYAAFGLELIVARDIGLTLLGRGTWMPVINFTNLILVDALLGIVFYL